jgi:5-carboxymethyl-2-hydroxymuconate isomerase
MKLATFSYRGSTRIGMIVGDRIYSTSYADSMTHMIRRGMTPNRAYEHFALQAVTLEAPLRPGKIVCIGRNYAEHAAETGSDLPTKPLIFAKFPSSIIATGQPITWDTRITQEVDWEGELAVVIGKKARHVAEADALNYVYGYTIANDVSARDIQLRSDSQWTRAKSLDTFCPLGPWIVTRDEIPDPQQLRIRTTVNDQVMQDASTADMVFSVAALIAYCSQMFTLEPGDLLLTGTPSGVGEGRKPPVYLKDGDRVTVTIENVGELTNPCRALQPE